MTSIPAFNALCAAWTKAVTISLMSCLLNAFGTGNNLSNGSVEGPTTSSDHPLANEEAAAPR